MNVGDLVICPANELNHGLATPSYLGVVLTVWGAMAEVAGGRDIEGIVNWQGKRGQTLWSVEQLTVVSKR